MTMVDPPSLPSAARRWIVAVVLLGLALTGAAWYGTKVQLDRLASERFLREARAVAEAIHGRLRDYEQVLRGGIALFSASDRVTRADWRVYVSTLELSRTRPGIQGMGFAQWTTDPAAVEQEIHGEGFPHFTVWPAGPRDGYAPIVMLEPFDWRNRRAFGYDMFSEPVRRAAMERARDEDSSVLSGKVRLVQETESDVQPGVLMYLPLYRGPAGDVAQRRANLAGFVYAPFRMHDLMTGVLEDAGGEVALAIHDGETVSAGSLLYQGLNQVQAPRHSVRLPLRMYGTRWTLVMASTPAFEANIDSRPPLLILVWGLTVTALLGVVTWAFAASRARARALAASHAAVAHARAEAESANRAKTRFLAAASHDLRQPLQSMALFLHVLEARLTTQEQRALAVQLRDSLATTQGLLEALMDIGTLESAATPAQSEPVDLKALVERIGRETLPAAAEKGLRLRVRTVPAQAVTDRVMIERMVRNLVHNAVRYTRSGGVLLALRRRGAGVRIEVWDSGPGIPEDKQTLIFEDFYRLESSSSGRGLGLGTVARLARLLGLSVELRSRPGHGSMFAIVLPAIGLPLMELPRRKAG